MNRTSKRVPGSSESGDPLSAAYGDASDIKPSVIVEGPSERSNNTLRAYREIRRRILDNEMQAGSQYLEQELAELLDMSRTPVREALIRLAEDRLVEVRPRHGVRILPLSAEDVRDIYELITELGVYAVRRIAERGLRDEDHAALAEAIRAMDDALAARDYRGWVDADRAFHDRLLSSAGNARLRDIGRTLADQSQQARMQALKTTPPTAATHLAHSALLDALRRQDVDEAQALKRQHCAAFAHELIRAVRGQNSD